MYRVSVVRIVIYHVNTDVVLAIEGRLPMQTERLLLSMGRFCFFFLTAVNTQVKQKRHFFRLKELSFQPAYSLHTIMMLLVLQNYQRYINNYGVEFYMVYKEQFNFSARHLNICYTIHVTVSST